MMPVERTPPSQRIPDDEGYTRVQSNKRRRKNSSTSDTSSRSSQNTPGSRNLRGPTKFTASLSKLPSHLRTAKSLFPLLGKLDTTISDIRFLPSGIALIYSPDPSLVHHLRRLRDLTQDPSIQIVAVDHQPRSLNTPYIRKATYSCVITGIDLDITLEDIEHRLAELDLPFKKIWRIRSRATDQDTRLIRVITEDKKVLDTLLQNGFSLFYQHHRVEPSHPSPPQPLQCQRCMAFHAPSEPCPTRPKCGHCGNNHLTRNCDFKTEPKCGNCTGNHPATSYKCPKRPTQPTSVEATAPLRCDDVAEKEDEAPSHIKVNDMIRFITTTLLNAMPDQRVRLQNIISRTAMQFFDTKIHISYAGNGVHIGCQKISYADMTSQHFKTTTV